MRLSFPLLAGSALLTGFTLATTLALTPMPPREFFAEPTVTRMLLFTNGTKGKEVIRHFVQLSDGTTQLRKLTSETQGQWTNPRLSPDGKTVLATLLRNGAKKVAMFPLDRPSALTIVPSPDTVDCEEPSWSPSGTRIVFKRTESRSPYRGEIVETDLKGENPDVITTSALFDGMEASCPSYSQNDGGRRIAFQCFYPDKTGGPYSEQIFYVNRVAKTAKKLTAGSTRHWHPAWHPTEDVLVYVKNDLGAQAKLWRLDASTRSEVEVSFSSQQGIDAGTDLIDPAFSPMGWLAFSARSGWSNANGIYRLFDLDPSFSNLTQVVPDSALNQFGVFYAVSPTQPDSQVAYRWTGSKGGTLTSPSFSAVEGDRFQVIGGKNVVVTHLAFEARAATQPTGTTAIFDIDGKLLVRAEISPTDTLQNGYYYKAIPPLTLLSGNRYYVGSLHGTGANAAYYHNTRAATLPPFLSDLGTYFKVSSTIEGGSWQGSAPRHYVPNFKAYQLP